MEVEGFEADQNKKKYAFLKKIDYSLSISIFFLKRKRKILLTVQLLMHVGSPIQNFFFLVAKSQFVGDLQALFSILEYSCSTKKKMHCAKLVVKIVSF